MAVNEVSGVLTKVDAEGNRTLMYPITKTENVDGLPEELTGLEETAATAAQQAAEAKSTARSAQVTAAAAQTALNGCWIEFTDEAGNPTDEPYIHWREVQ